MIWGDRIKVLFRMRAESIPQGYGIYSARIRNMRLIQEKIVDGVVFLKRTSAEVLKKAPARVPFS